MAPTLTIRRVALDALHTDPANARAQGPANMAAIEASSLASGSDVSELEPDDLARFLALDGALRRPDGHTKRTGLDERVGAGTSSANSNYTRFLKKVIVRRMETGSHDT